MDAYNKHSILYVIEGQQADLFKKSKTTFSGSGDLKLNLGCGNKHIKGYINIDTDEPCDLKHDLRKPLPFTDNSVDEVFSEGNVISLFSFKDWNKLKKEIVRILRPGGKAGFVFQDFEYVLKSFLAKKKEERINTYSGIFGSQVDKKDFQMNGFTPDKLISELKDAGIEKFAWKRLSDKTWVHLQGFKNGLLLAMTILMFVPRLVWADLSYFMIDLMSDGGEPSAVFLTSISKRKKKLFSKNASIVIEWQQT